jgi:hypothetical protein
MKKIFINSFLFIYYVWMVVSTLLSQGCKMRDIYVAIRATKHQWIYSEDQFYKVINWETSKKKN